MQPSEECLRLLVEHGKQRGYVTYEEVKAGVPDWPTGDAGAELIDRLLHLLEESGVELINDSESLRRQILERASVQAEDEDTHVEFVPPGWPAETPALLAPPLAPAPPADLDGTIDRAWPPGDRSLQCSFFDAIRAAPDDDSPRLVYADWLEEQGHPVCLARAEFIRVQARLAHLWVDDPQRTELEEREADLLAAYEKEWVGPFLGLLRDLARHWEYNPRGFVRRWRFERGFFTVDVHNPDDVLDLAPTLFEAGLPALVGIHNGVGCLVEQWNRWPEFVGSPHLRHIIRVESFDMDGGGAVLGNAVAQSPYLSWLSCLDLVEEHIGPAWLRTLSAQERLARLPALRLELQRNYLGDEALAILAESPNFCRLVELHIGDAQTSHATITSEGLHALATAPHLSRLRRLHVSCADLDAGAWHALMSSQQLTGLRELALTHCNIGDMLRGAQQATPACLPRLDVLDFSRTELDAKAIGNLAECPALARLTTLHLADTGIGDEAVEVLTTSSTLANLTTLDLHSTVYFQDLPTNHVSGTGLRALLTSPTLTRLTRLDLASNAVTGAALDGWVTTSPRRHLTWLDLSGNRLGAQGAALLALAPWLPGLEVLDLSLNAIGDDGAEALARSLGGGRLRVLKLAYNRLHARSAWALAAAPHLRQVTFLHLARNRLGDEGVQALAASPFLRDLRSLNLGHTEVGPDAVRALGASPNFSRLLRLDLSGNPIGPQGARALAASPYLTRLSDLHLDSCDIGADGLEALAQSPYLTRLSVLSVGGNGLDPACLESLGRTTSLRRLTRLKLGFAEPPPNFSAALRNLVHSPALTRLNRLELG
jgi:uncharacterized protein (TIGR02996 family)